MAFRGPIKPTLAIIISHFVARKPIPAARAGFILPGFGARGGLQTVTASRVLPYAKSKLFDLIADVDSYAQFVPYCRQSRVTHWTTSPCAAAASAGAASPAIATQKAKRLPLQADLHVGWGTFEEVFTSRLVCDPKAGLVEARSGRDVMLMSTHQQLGRNNRLAPCPDVTSATTVTPGGVFTALVTRWTIEPLSGPAKSSPHKYDEWSKVDLRVEFQFANPLYSAISGAASENMAAVITEAFEKHARNKLGAPWQSPACPGLFIGPEPSPQ